MEDSKCRPYKKLGQKINVLVMLKGDVPSFHPFSLNGGGGGL